MPQFLSTSARVPCDTYLQHEANHNRLWRSAELRSLDGGKRRLVEKAFLCEPFFFCRRWRA